MFKKMSAVLLLLLTSCNPSPKQGADGYTFGEKQYEKSTVQINIVTYQSSADLQRALGNRAGVDASNVVAFSVLRPPFDTCTIHMVDPAVAYQPEFVGHEMLHCVYGQWHKNNKTF
jgi:hypothetical protein